MVAWYAGESNEIPKVIKGLHSGAAPIFDVVWLVMWTFFGLSVSLWVLATARERSPGDGSGSLTLRKQIAGIGRTWEFDTSQIALSASGRSTVQQEGIERAVLSLTMEQKPTTSPVSSRPRFRNSLLWLESGHQPCISRKQVNQKTRCRFNPLGCREADSSCAQKIERDLNAVSTPKEWI